MEAAHLYKFLRSLAKEFAENSPENYDSKYFERELFPRVIDNFLGSFLGINPLLVKLGRKFLLQELRNYAKRATGEDFLNDFVNLAKLLLGGDLNKNCEQIVKNIPTYFQRLIKYV